MRSQSALVGIFVDSILCVSVVLGDSSPPVTPVPAEPALTVTKDAGTNSVVFNWTVPGGTSPFALSRSTNPNFATGPAVPLQGGLTGTNATDSGVLTDGNNYFYKVDDSYDGPRVLGLSVNQALPGTVITASGVNFDPTASSNTVFVNEVGVVATSSTDTSVQFTVPTGAVSGYLRVENPTGSSRPVPFTILNSATPLSNITSLAVDSGHTAFVTDVGTAATSDKIYKINADHTLTQVGGLNDPTGLGIDASDFVYYGNSFNDPGNAGLIRKTNSAGTESDFGNGGCGSPQVTSWIYGVGVDNIGGTSVYEWDRNISGIKKVPPGAGACASTLYISNLGILAARPQGVVANNNASSPRAHNLTISLPAPEIREYSTGPTPALLKSWTPATVPFSSVAQLAIVPDPNQRLLIADRTGNKVVLLNQSTDASLALDWNVTNPRAVAVDTLPDGRVNALVGEATSVKAFPLAFSVVNVQIWKETGAGVPDVKILEWFENAKAYWLTVRVNLRLRGMTTFTDPSLRDLDKKVLTYHVGDPYQFTSEETSLFSMRASDPRDLNIFVVRNLINVDTQAVLTDPGGYTVTHDLRSNVTDATNSGIVISAAILQAASNRGADKTVMAHEIGHALLYQGSWPEMDEHFSHTTHALYTKGFLMDHVADPSNTRIDSDEANNISTNGPFIIFRSDP